MKLAIISHTSHYMYPDGRIGGWGPTIREINYMAPHFDEILHIAPLHQGEVPDSCLSYDSPNIRFVALSPSGGDGFAGKLSVLRKAFSNFRVVKKHMKEVDVFQFRAPTGIGVYMVPYLAWFCKNKGWFKYAGNWKEPKPPLSYALQRLILAKAVSKKVTINGAWPDQPTNCVTFENPCLSDLERISGFDCLKEKDYSGPLDFLFLGRLSEEKGVGRIIEAFKLLKPNARIGTIHMIGDGPMRAEYEKKASLTGHRFVFHGFMARDKIETVVAQCHVFLLPSDSEGFPKVVAEAANFGCIPVVTNVSCLDQYINEKVNGMLVPYNNEIPVNLSESINYLLVHSDLKEMARKAYLIAEKFTFEHYISRIKHEILQ